MTHIIRLFNITWCRVGLVLIISGFIVTGTTFTMNHNLWTIFYWGSWNTLLVKNDLLWLLFELILNRNSKEPFCALNYSMALQCYIRYHTVLFDSNTGTGDFQFQFTGDFKSWVLDYILVIFRFQLFLHHLNQVRPWIEPKVTCSGFKAGGYNLDWLKSKNKQKLQLITKPIEQFLISDHLLEPDFLIIRSICPIKLGNLLDYKSSIFDIWSFLYWP